MFVGMTTHLPRLHPSTDHPLLNTPNQNRNEKKETKKADHGHHGGAKQVGKAVKDTARGAWDYGTAKAGEVVFGDRKWERKGSDYDDDSWKSYGYEQYSSFPDGYGWEEGKEWEGDYLY